MNFWSFLQLATPPSAPFPRRNSHKTPYRRSILPSFPFTVPGALRPSFDGRDLRLTQRRPVPHARNGYTCHLYPKSNLNKRNHEHRVYPYLLRGLPITYPNQVWGIDITYIRLVWGWMYLVGITDWYTRFVVSWALDQCLETAFVLIAVKEAIAKAKPEIMNSDQGAQFTDPLKNLRSTWFFIISKSS